MSPKNASILALITARGGSKGVPGKNVRLLGGRPLIAWTIEAALKSARITRVVVSTDDKSIAEAAARAGAEVPFMRPSELARDETAHPPVVLHALDQMGDDWEYVLVLQPTSPFRRAEDIDAAVAEARRLDADALVSVRPADDHPWLAKTLGPDGRLRPFVADAPKVTRRQDLAAAFVPNGAIYLIRPAVLRRHVSLYPPGVAAWRMAPERSLDIDTEWDFKLAQAMVESGLLA